MAFQAGGVLHLPFACTGNEPDDSTSYGYSAAALSRFFFVLGRASVQHLLCIEQTSKAIRAARLAADRAAAEAVERQMAAEAAGAGSSGSRRGKAAAVRSVAEDIGAQLGVGSVAADAELDALAESIEAQVSVVATIVAVCAVIALSGACGHLLKCCTCPAYQAPRDQWLTQRWQMRCACYLLHERHGARAATERQLMLQQTAVCFFGP